MDQVEVAIARKLIQERANVLAATAQGVSAMQPQRVGAAAVHTHCPPVHSRHGGAAAVQCCGHFNCLLTLRTLCEDPLCFALPHHCCTCRTPTWQRALRQRPPPFRTRKRRYGGGGTGKTHTVLIAPICLPQPVFT